MQRTIRISALIGWAVVWLASVIDAVSLRAASLDDQFGVGSWIWDREVHDWQECRFVRVFRIPEGAKVTAAVLRITADNSYRLFLDGEAIGRGADWRVLTEYDVSLLLNPGEHVLAVDALNDFHAAGFLFGLHAVLSNGSVIEIASDASWRIAPDNGSNWQRAEALNQWPAATVKQPFDSRVLIGPFVYRAPISQPVRIEFWQRRGFHVTLLAAIVASVAVGLFLTSRLILKSQAERVVRRERARIALDLHDSLGGGLTHLLLLGENAGGKVRWSLEEAGAMGQQVCDRSRELLREMNETVWLINSQRDTIRDFASYVAKYAESFFLASSIRCWLDVQADIAPLPCDLGIRRNLFLAAKEAMNNVLRHSQASAVHVKISYQRQELTIVIRDNGCGFDPTVEKNGNGLRNMKLRAAEAGARFVLKSDPGSGSSLEFRVSLTSVRPGFWGFLRGCNQEDHRSKQA